MTTIDFQIDEKLHICVEQKIIQCISSDTEYPVGHSAHERECS